MDAWEVGARSGEGAGEDITVFHKRRKKFNSVVMSVVGCGCCIIRGLAVVWRRCGVGATKECYLDAALIARWISRLRARLVEANGVPEALPSPSERASTRSIRHKYVT